MPLEKQFGDGGIIAQSSARFMVLRHMEQAVGEMGLTDLTFLMGVLLLWREEWVDERSLDGAFLQLLMLLIDRHRGSEVENA